MLGLAIAALLSLRCAASACSTVALATFDGAPSSTVPFQPINDPVMGGMSHSTATVDKSQKVLLWQGEVKIVPFLQKPGFCNLQAPGYGQQREFPDCTGTEGLSVVARRTGAGLRKFRALFSSTGSRHGFKVGQYGSSFTFGTGSMRGDGWEEFFLPWSSFHCEWRGQNMTCPEPSTQLAQINTIGLGTFYPLDKPQGFKLEVKSISCSCSIGETSRALFA